MRSKTSSEQVFWTFQRAAGALLVASIVPLALALFLFNSRNGAQGGPPRTPTLFVWEHGSVLAAVVLTALGLVLLEAALHETNGRIMARLGASTYFFGAVLLAAGEAMVVGRTASFAGGLIVIYVVLALLGQAAIGGALLQSNILPAWIGWVAIVWNLTLLIVLPIVTPGDVYYPVAHHVVPVLIGVPLLFKASA